MQIVYAQEALPMSGSKSLFLAGPSPREATDANWRPGALEELERQGYDGIVYVPLPRGGVTLPSYEGQIEWEEACLHRADVIVFWVPRDLAVLPGFSTNVEWGAWAGSGKVVLGFPPGTAKMRYMEYYARKWGISVSSTLGETLASALQRLDGGASRQGGEMEIPLHIWRLPFFQAWLQAQKKAGNRLEGARVEWALRVGPPELQRFFCILRVRLWVEAESRAKSNEVVLFRPPIASLVAYHRDRDDLLQSQVLLVREFRSAGATSDGFVHELPGGSAWAEDKPPLETALEELEEETGFSLPPERLRLVGQRQMMATLAAHAATVFAAELSNEEFESLRKQAEKPHGVFGTSEITYVETATLGDLLTQEAVDWAQMGMILTSLLQSGKEGKG